MISKNRIKFISSLRKRKAREETGYYVIEGDKLVREFLESGIKLKILAAKPEFIGSLSDEKLRLAEEVDSVTNDELKHISTLTAPHNALAVVKRNDTTPELSEILNTLTVALDCIQDPGNLGTIIRASAWFGIKNVICSEDSVDVYNPKVIQASMGAILHVSVVYKDLKEVLEEAKKRELPVYGSMLEGRDLGSEKIKTEGILVFGNESKGISDELKPFITKKILIPGAGSSKPGIESLNVGMAASIMLYEFTRKASHL